MVKGQSRLALTKLVVDDLDAVEHFYTTVMGLRPFRRTPKGEPRFGKEEVAMSSTGKPGADVLILMRFVDRPCSPPGSCFLGFVVEDAADVMNKAECMGAKIIMPLAEDATEAVRFAVLKDPAGHIVEILQQC